MKMRTKVSGTVILGWMFLSPHAMAWVPGGAGGNVELGGTIEPSGPTNPWEVILGADVAGMNMVLPESGQLIRHRLKTNLPVLGIRTTTGQDETFGGEAAGGLAPQVSYSGLVTGGSYDKGRVPVELLVTGEKDNQTLGWLRLNLFAGAEVSQYNPESGNGKRYSVYAGQPGEAFYGGIARTPNEAMDNALVMIGDIFESYTRHYNPQGLPGITGQKQSAEFRNNKMRYSGFYGAGLLAGDEVVMRLDEGSRPEGAENWRARLKVTINYQ